MGPLVTDVAAFFTSPKVWRLTGVAIVTGAAVVWVKTAGEAAGGRGKGFKILEVELSADPKTVPASRVGAVEHALHADFPFIAGYTLLLVLAVLMLTPCFRLRLLRTKGPGVLFCAAVAAGLCDVVENCLLLDALPADPDANRLFLLAAFFAISKVVLIGFVLIGVLGAFMACVTTPQWLTQELARDTVEGKRKQELLGELVAPTGPTRGISASGGGVRAASLTLGSLQALEQQTAEDPDPVFRWNNPDLVVTSVSGGGYMAGGWQLARSQGVPLGGDLPWAAGTGGAVGREERHLIDNLGYLASTWPRGHRDEIGAPDSVTFEEDHVEQRVNDRLRNSASVAATLFVGFAVNVLVLLAILVLFVVGVTELLDRLVDMSHGKCELLAKVAEEKGCVSRQPRFWLPPLLWLAAAAALAPFWVLASKVFRYKPVLLSLKGAVRGALAMGLVLGILLVAFPALIEVATRWHGKTAIGAVTTLVGYVGSVGQLLRTRAAAIAPKLAGVFFIAFVVAASAWLAVEVLKHGHQTEKWLLVGAAVVLVGAWIAGAELWSMFAFYRGKLRMAYAVRRYVVTETRDDGRSALRVKAVSYVNDGDKHPQRYLPEPDLADIKGSPLTICAAAHATTRAIKTHYGIPAVSFTFTPDYIVTHIPRSNNGPYVASTENVQASYRGSGGSTSGRITTMFAVALAGAAIAPAMGRERIGPTSALITFGNVRLGAWLPNPKYVQRNARKRIDEAKNRQSQVPEWLRVRWTRRQVRFPKVRLSYLMREFLGIHDPSDLYVYVSDGGHWENAGLVELLRRDSIREVVCVDADPGDQTRVNQLAKAVDLAQLECNVTVLIDLDPLRALPTGDGPAYAERSVAMGVLKRGNVWGLIWYGKAVLGLDSPTTLLAHREFDPQFPHTSTVDQFFDVATYKAYRDLGRYNAHEIKRGRKALREALGAAAGLPQLPPDKDAPGRWAIRDFLRVAKDLDVAERTALLAQVRELLPTGD